MRNKSVACSLEFTVAKVLLLFSLLQLSQTYKAHQYALCVIKMEDYVRELRSQRFFPQFSFETTHFAENHSFLLNNNGANTSLHLAPNP